MCCPEDDEARALEKRAVVAKKLEPVKVEAIVRGYLAGSGWKGISKAAACGIALPAGLQEAQQLPEVIFTPSTKAAVGDRDENITALPMRADYQARNLAAEVRAKAIELYSEAAAYAKTRSIIILRHQI